MKKILIASLFVTLMLLVPIASVMSSSEITHSIIKKSKAYAVEQISNISDKNFIRLDRKLTFLSLITNIIMLRFSENQVIVSQCKNIQSELEAFTKGLFDVICESFEEMILSLEDLLIALNEIAPWAAPFLVPILLVIVSRGNL